MARPRPTLGRVRRQTLDGAPLRPWLKAPGVARRLVRPAPDPSRRIGSAAPFERSQ